MRARPTLSVDNDGWSDGRALSSVTLSCQLDRPMAFPKRAPFAALALALPFTFFAACSSSSDAGAPADTGGPVDTGVVTDGGSDGGLLELLEVACNDSVADTYAAPTSVTGAKGSILKCAKDGDVSKDVMYADDVAEGYSGKTFASGARIYRIQYVTERANGKPGFGSAIVYLPTAPAAAKMPIAVVNHGTGGQAGKCAPSQDVKGSAKGGMLYMVRPLVGMGIPVIAPDYAGFAGFGAKDNPPSGYAFSEDVSRSALDAARALQLMIPSRLAGKVVLVGHSQGGHTTLSALAKAESYAPELNIAAVAVYAPLWFSQLSWGAMIGLPDYFQMKDSSFAIAVNIWYHYSHAEIIDGPGKGAELFVPAKRAALKDFFDNKCQVDDAFKALGNTVADFYDPALSAAIGTTAVGGDPCTNADPTAKALCETWSARYKADRPHLTGKALTVPLLVWQGDADATLTPDRAVCGFDRLRADKANLTACVKPGADHTPLVYQASSEVADWVAARVLGAPEPTKCAKDDSALIDPKTGKRFTCNTPPPNDKD